MFLPKMNFGALRMTFRVVATWATLDNFSYDLKVDILRSSAKILIFRVPQMQIWIAPLERARETGQENGMVGYISMNILFEIFQVETTSILLIRHFYRFSWIFNPSYLKKYLSKYIKAYRFLIRFWRSFQWYHSFLHLRNSKNWYF